MALALIAFAGSTASACGTCGCAEKAKNTSSKEVLYSAASDCSSHTNATKASAKSSCPSQTNTLKASASASCTPAEMEACAEKLGVTVEECQKMCGENGSMTMHKISIKGMTCTSCEEFLTKVIEGVDGVKKVTSISHKDASAVVCVDKNSNCLTTLTKAITDKGYKAEIITASSSVAAPAIDQKSCAKTCSPAAQAACGVKETPKKAEDTK